MFSDISCYYAQIKVFLNMINIIATVMEKTQWNRAIESAKKLIEHIGKMERKIPNRESVIANIFSLIGNAYLELGDDKKALAFHLKDLHLSSELYVNVT